MWKEDLSLMASPSAPPLIWLSPTKKTECFFGVFGLLLCAHKALCTFGLLVVALSDDSYRLSKTAKLLGSVIRLFNCWLFLCLMLSELLLFTGI